MEGWGAHLVERSNELGVVERSLWAAREGRGALVLLEGPAGIGKTELLGAAMVRARHAGMLVLSARGGELESSFPYAVVRQLFEPALMQADRVVRGKLLSGAAVHARSVVDPRAEPASTAVEESAVLHGLYWLTANLAADRPVLLIVDDVHWGDPASLSWLVYLARRIEGLRVALILGARSFEPGIDGALLERLRSVDGVQRVVPEPLSPAAVEDLARAALGEQVQREFSQACHVATGGNPFYVTELLRVLRADRVTGTAANVRAIDGLTPRAVVDALLARLGRMPSEARDVAEAVALLEPNAELRWIAELTGLDVDVVATVADSLAELGLLQIIAPCRFEHPILRSAVEGEISPARRGRLHLKAARALRAAAMPVDSLAAHLLQTPPSGESWVVAALREAAAQASARGAPAAAVSYLERALAEAPAASARRELLLELGRAESQTQRPQASRHLQEALALTDHPEQAAAAGFALGQALFNEGAIDRAYQILRDVVERSGGRDSPAVLELQAYLVAVAGPAGRMTETAGYAQALDAGTPDDSPAAPTVHACLALRELVAGQPRARVRERARRAIVGLQHGSGTDAPGMALLWIDDLDHAEKLFSEALNRASRLGRVRSFENYSALRGYTVRRRGDLADAAADIEPILAAVAQGAAPRPATLIALVTQVLLLIDHAKPDAAEALARGAPIPAALERLPIVALLREAQAAAQLAQRKSAAAAATLRRVGEVCETGAIRSPAMVAWRSQLALALAGSDLHDEGIELARAELRLAERCDVDRARGVALRALGVLEGGDAGLRRLQAAVDALQRSPARLELGWASYELGAALRRAKRRRESRAPLDRALDLALGCGAELLAQRAGEELQALGARPRSVMLTGVESLTASERRVCRLAAEGLKNREIAQALFVTLNTVETHLRSSYRKLDIASRSELPQTLGMTRR